MKFLITFLAAATVLLASCKTTDTAAPPPPEEGSTAQVEVQPDPPVEPVTDWYKGDILGAMTLCRDQPAITRLVYADMQGEAEVKEAMRRGSLAGECIITPQPFAVPILDIVAEYVDHAKRPSVVLLVGLPRWIEGDVAYIIATGRRGPKKEEHRKKHSI